MSTDAIITGIVAILVAVLGGGFWQYRQSRKEAPVKKRDADLAAAETSQRMALAIAEDLREDVGRLRDELGAERDERQKLTGRMDAAERRILEQDRTIRNLRDAVRAFTDAWDLLEERWHTVRQSDRPPQRPKVPTD